MDEEYFLLIADKYKDTIYRIALNYLRNSYDADDIVQDVLMKLYLSRKTFEGENHIRNWLIRVTINHCKNALRAPWRRRNVAFEELAETVIFDENEKSELFFMVMDLSEKYRIVLYLFYYEEFSVKEIASLLKLTETAVTSRLMRARNQLKQKLAEVSCDERF